MSSIARFTRLSKACLFGALAVSLAPAACSSADPVATGPGTTYEAGAYPYDASPYDSGYSYDAATYDAGPRGPIKTVFVIMMENHDWKTIANNTYASYINDTLVHMGAHLENYKTPPGNHPSEPNYLWLEAGDNLGVKDDNAPATNHQATKDHLTAQLDTAGISWKAYAEGIKGDVCPLTASGNYDPKHTPQLFFDDVTGTNQPDSAYCLAHVRPYTELDADIAANKVARYNFITPDLCNDMHGNGFVGDCGLLGGDGHIKLGNAWLTAQIPKLLASNAYRDNGVIFIVWDEGDASIIGTSDDGPMGMIALSPLAKPNYTSSIAYTHSSLFRTIEQIFGVPYLRAAQGATSLSELFVSFP
jgi:phospholipase C